jgi:DNA (cytosine-5)-methyltransferase 1
MHTVAFCEIDPYCRKVLNRHWPEATIHEDVKQLDGKQYDGSIDLICGGYPCQPFSTAGKQDGEEDHRHLWPEMRRIIREARPRWVIAENVRGHVSIGFDTVAAQMEDDGYTVWPFLIPACAVNAPHRRERLWIVAHSPSERLQGSIIGKSQNKGQGDLDAALFPTLPLRTPPHENDLPKPFVVGKDDGIPNRSHRIKALGNAVVPQIPELIGRAIIQYERQLTLAA